MWGSLPSRVSGLKDVRRVLQTLSTYQTCIGNPEETFLNLDLPSQRKDRNCEAFKEKDFGACAENFRFLLSLFSLLAKIKTKK